MRRRPPSGRGLLHLVFAQFHALLADLLLAFGPLQAGVYLGVDLGEAVELLTDGVDLLFQLVVLAAFGLVRIGGPTVVGSGVAGGSGSGRGLGGLRQIARKVVAVLGINSPIGAISGGGLVEA